ncbi:hypothetical protein I552_2278 [Mycobacterium xenopi 3993]|nr:hypothetical protein I552_2278 [Mycobacterium xenopi 3993]
MVTVEADHVRDESRLAAAGSAARRVATGCSAAGVCPTPPD